MSFNAWVTPVVPVGNTGSPVKVGEAKLAFKSKAACCKVLIGLLTSLVLSIFPIPKFVLALLAVVAPVPPLATATVPDTLVAFPVTVPVKLPVIFPVTLPVTLPVKFPLKVLAVMVFPEKSPIGLLRTIELTIFEEVAAFIKLTAFARSSFGIPAIESTSGAAAVPPKSPAN